MNCLEKQVSQLTSHHLQWLDNSLISGGGSAFINPPYELAKKKRSWKKTIRVIKGKLYITFSSCRVKKREGSGYDRSAKLAYNMRDIKGQMYDKQQGVCPHCGQKYEMRTMELHHILPWGRFPDLRTTRRNLLLLCHTCHKEIHCNPWKNIEMMKAKAEELGIDLHDYYSYGESISG